jgi:hypothetical protein
MANLIRIVKMIMAIPNDNPIVELRNPNNGIKIHLLIHPKIPHPNGIIFSKFLSYDFTNSFYNQLLR